MARTHKKLIEKSSIKETANQLKSGKKTQSIYQTMNEK